MEKAKANSAKAKKSETKNGNESKKKASWTKKYAEKYARKLVPPATGEPKTKEANKKTFHFCPYHNNSAGGAWVIHQPNTCDRRDEKKTERKDKAIFLTKVLQAIQDKEADDASSEKEE